VIFLVAMVLFALALARPQAALSLPRPEGIVMLTFDVSGSMGATDLEPSRLEVAKEVAHAFVDERPTGVVIGLVAFSDAGLSVQAPTTDELELKAAIDRLRPTLGTSLGQGMLAAIDAIERLERGAPPEYYSNRSPEPTLAPEPLEPGSHGAAVVVLLTDGENTVLPDPVEVARSASEKGIRVHTVGLATLAGATLETDGFTVHTALDEALLTRVSELTAGTYYTLDTEGESVDAAAAESVDPHDVFATLGRQVTTRAEPMEVTSLFAGAGLMLLLAGAATSLAVSGRLE
jgi:Ca-activated chloride channel family protein